jgi:sugar (pentulose or hexulose) kinase
MLVNSCPLRRGLYFCGSGINNCTIATNWLLKIFEEPVDYLRGAALSNPGANGVMTFPYFTGERDRVIGNIGTGVVLGLGLNTTRADLARSFLEGVAFSYLLVKRALDSSFPATELRLGGGGSSNSNWMQVIADVLDLPVRVTGHPEMGIVGAAGIARHGDMAALRAASDRIMADAVRIEPRPAVTAVYRELAQRYFAVRATLAAPLRAHLPPPS